MRGPAAGTPTVRPIAAIRALGAGLAARSAWLALCSSMLLCPAAAWADGRFLAESHPVVESGGATSRAGERGLTDHFRGWLSDHGYGQYDFPRDDLEGGSFGGKRTADDPIENQPVVFVHGNSDKALGTQPGQTGWTATRRYFLANGYTPAELYATTWGPADPTLAAQQYHSRAYLTRIRRFMEAVLAYTGAAKIDVIAHSMGVTLARKAIKGGAANDPPAGGEYDLGAPLTDRIDTFVGIAGANRGLVACFVTAGVTPTCDAKNGLYPGFLWFFGMLVDVSEFLTDVNAREGYEGAFVYSIWSRADQVIGYGGLVYGRYTSRIPGQDGELVFDAAPYGHFNTKDLTAAAQLAMIRRHTVE